MLQIQQLEIGVVLFVTCLIFFLLGYQWANSQQSSDYNSLESEDDEIQKLEQQLRDYKQREGQYLKQIDELKKQIGTGTPYKNTDL